MLLPAQTPYLLFQVVQYALLQIHQGLTTHIQPILWLLLELRVWLLVLENDCLQHI